MIRRYKESYPSKAAAKWRQVETLFELDVARNFHETTLSLFIVYTYHISKAPAKYYSHLSLSLSH